MMVRFALRSLGPLVVGLLLVIGSVSDSFAQRNHSGISTFGRSGGVAVDIPINKSDVLRSARAFQEVAVGNPEIADVQILGDRSIYIFGRKFGSTSVTLSDEFGQIIAVVDVNVIHDVGRLKRMLHSLLPKERIAVRPAYDGIVLSGTVSSAAKAAQAAEIAERFAPEAVSNLMTVRGSQQVMLAVRFVEMRRNALKRLGIGLEGTLADGTISFVGNFVNAIVNPPSRGFLNGTANFGGDFLTGALDALEEKGVVRTLAEPVLVAMSGDTADFLAGGEFPLPVGARDDEIKLEFKKFGVGLSFTPTVLADDLINLRLHMEVSEPDETLDLQILGVSLPGLTVRRATTTIELRNAQSFAVAGLLRETFNDQVSQLPFVGDIPILGALSRSTQYQSGQTELVMIVTPYLAKPVDGDRLRSPGFVPPSEQELFLNGAVETEDRIDPNLHNSAGFSGPHGYSSW